MTEEEARVAIEALKQLKRFIIIMQFALVSYVETTEHHKHYI